MSRMYVMVSTVIGILTTTANGHGVQIQVTFNPATQQIETREIVHSDTRPTAISELKRAYILPLMPLTGSAGDGWYSRPDDTRDIFGVPLHPTGPGICYQYDAVDQIPGTGWSYAGSSTLPNIESSNFGFTFTDALRYWDGASFVDPGIEQMQMFRGSGTSPPNSSADTTDAPPYATLALSTITSRSSNPHHSAGFRMLGDGRSPGLDTLRAGDAGVYLVSLQIGSTAPGVSASDPFYFVLYEGVPLAHALTAASSLGLSAEQIQIAPEPSSFISLLPALAMAGRRRTARADVR